MVTFKIGEQQEENDDDLDLLTEFIIEFLYSATVTHIMHWQTTSYAAHVALGEYYKEIPELVDSLVEAYQGKKNIILSGYPTEKSSYEDFEPLRYMEMLSNTITECRYIFGDDSEIQNLVDAIADLVDSTMYKLRRFK